jgi:hypothetical protein
MPRRSSALLFSEIPWSILLVFFYALRHLVPATYFIARRSLFPTSTFVASDGHLSGNATYQDLARRQGRLLVMGGFLHRYLIYLPSD